MNRAATVLLFAVISANLLAASTNITYQVNLDIGAGSVSGSIVTDGKIGVLGQADIVAYNLVLSDPAGGTTTVNLSCCNFFPFQGSDLSATATQLLFNFSGTDGGVIDFATASDAYDVCFSTSGGAFGPSSFCEGAGETLTYTSGPVPIIQNFEFTSLAGTQVIGTTAATGTNKTYYVNLTIGAGSITGNIVTDGKIGVLGQADIVGWDLLLNDGTGAWDLACCTSSILFGFSGSDLSATATQLLFNFSGTDNGILEISDGSLDYDVCFSASTASQGSVLCNGGSLSAARPGETITFMTAPAVFNYPFTSLSGTQVIAATAAPPPSTYNITFAAYPGQSPVLPTFGSFTYDASQPLTSRFSHFTVDWNGYTFDLTGAANNGGNDIIGKQCGTTPTSADIFSFLRGTGICQPTNLIAWFTQASPGYPVFTFFDETDANTTNVVGIADYLNVPPASVAISAGGTFSTTQIPAFFTGAASLGSGVYYLQFPNSDLFGYYTFVASSIFFHYDMGYEAWIPASAADIYLYDFTSSHWFYTSSSLFPYLYDFTLNSWLYYFPNTTNPGHYTAGPRYFSNLTTGKIFTM
jgi:hypothetical protein